MENKKYKSKGNMKYFYILIVIFLIIWRVPLLFLELGVIWSALLIVMALIIASLIVKLIKQSEN